MPRNWFYYIALVCPIALHIVLLDTNVVDWLWYQHYEKAYYFLATLRVQPQFLAFLSWKYAVFAVAVICWWQIEDADDGVPLQFLLLPLGYIPFAIVADMLPSGLPEGTNLYSYPLTILPFGYAYVFVWTLIIWILGKLRLVIS